MIRINLLPHREEKRKRNKKAFVALAVMFAMVGALVVLVVGGFFATQISIQNQRNQILETENKALDEKIKEIASLKQDIESLKARQQAVEDLQSDRNQPVYLMDELVKQTPEGVHFRSFKQEGQRIVMSGYAQSTARVADLLERFGNNSQWLERPALVVSTATNLGAGKGAKSVYDFTINVGIKRPRDKDKDKPDEATGKTAGANAASAKPGAALAPAPSAAASAVASSVNK
jgi:type IV pilus assembly protein PilN